MPAPVKLWAAPGSKKDPVHFQDSFNPHSTPAPRGLTFSHPVCLCRNGQPFAVLSEPGAFCTRFEGIKQLKNRPCRTRIGGRFYPLQQGIGIGFIRICLWFASPYKPPKPKPRFGFRASRIPPPETSLQSLDRPSRPGPCPATPQRIHMHPHYLSCIQRVYFC